MNDALFALLIGIDDYQAYDASAGRAPGTSDLRGSVNDVRLYLRTLQALGLPPQNIRVLTSPPLDAAGLGAPDGVAFGDATRASIEAGVAWLADVLTGESRGLLAFCGHGDADARGLLLCPADVTAGLAAAIPYADVAARLDARRPGTDVTVILDACHAAPGASSERARHRSLRGGAAPRVERKHGRSADVVLAASAADAPSYECLLHGEWHGAFSWAATTLLDRWGVAPEGTCFALTHGELVERARRLLDDLAIDQRPVCDGPASARDERVLGGRESGAHGEPRGAIAPREVPVYTDGYILQDTNGNSIGYIAVTASQITWNWTSQSAAWPSHFYLQQSGTKPTTTYSVKTERSQFPTQSGSYSLSGVQWQIKQGGSVVGYLKKTSTALVWYSISARTEFDAADMEFPQNTDSSTQTLYKVADAFL
jgi:hypothetical protein